MLRRVNRSRSAGALAIGLLFLLPCVGCGLFDMRDPEPPASSEVPYVPPTQPYIVLVNLKVSTKAKSTSNFDRSLTTDYTWRFDPFDVVNDSTWAKDRDISALEQVFRNTGTVDFTWTPTDSGTWESGRYYGNLGYRLVFRRSATDSVLFRGKCTIYLRQTGTLWQIYRWADVNDGTDVSTWGYAKLNPNFGS